MLYERSVGNQKLSHSRKEKTATLDLGFHHSYMMGCNLGTVKNGSRLKLAIHSVKVCVLRHEKVPLQFPGIKSKKTKQSKNGRRQANLEGTDVYLIPDIIT